MLENLPTWLEKSLSKIRETNNKLKKISKEKKESRLSSFLESKAESKPSEEDVSYGAHDCDIGKCNHHQLSFKSLNSLSAAVVDRIKAGTLDIENFCLGCHIEIMGSCLEHPLFMGGLCNRECKVQSLKSYIQNELFRITV